MSVHTLLDSHVAAHYYDQQLSNLPVSDIFCCLLITFANSLDPDQARPNIGSDLDPNCLTLSILFLI